MGDPTLEEAYRILQCRYESVCEGSIKAQAEVMELRDKVQQYDHDRARAAAESEAAKQNLQLVVDDYNSRDRDKNNEVERLRKLLKAHGINPGN